MVNECSIAYIRDKEFTSISNSPLIKTQRVYTDFNHISSSLRDSIGIPSYVITLGNEFTFHWYWLRMRHITVLAMAKKTAI